MRPTECSALLGDSSEKETELKHTNWFQSFRRLGQPSRATRGAVTVLGIAICGWILMMVVMHYHQSTTVLTSTAIEYDFIVIGGGPAGSVVSKLLSDDASRRVLLIEAGNASQVDLGGKIRINSTFNSKSLTPFDVPYYWTNVANTDSYHWEYPDVNVVKALGGCGVHNAMLYVRALPSDLDRWKMKKWTWVKALEIYKRMEDFDGPRNTSFHGFHGMVRTSSPSNPDLLSQAFLQACEEVGIPRTDDFNAPHGRVGAGYYHFNTRNGIRESAARVFLSPIIKTKRPNFQLMLNTIVHKVNFNAAVTHAIGVTVEHADGRQETLRVTPKGEVILTAGAISTPKVLMQSGLGHKSELERLGIEVKKHFPRVGMNLQDHPVLAMTFESPNAQEVDLVASLSSYFEAVKQNATNVTSYGLMGSAGISVGAFLIPPGATIPEIQLTFFPRSSEPHVANSSALNHPPAALITVALLHPIARNRIVLSRDVNSTFIPRVVSEVPDAEEEHLSHDDIWKLAWGITVVREIATVLVRRGVIGDEIIPGRSVTTMNEIQNWVRNAVFRNSHWVGSAAMGNSEGDGVVDHNLRVFGIDNFRVADASIIPTIPNGNVHSSVLMVASHAAELIRDEKA